MSNEMKLTGFVANVKKVSDKLVVFGLAVGVKQQDGSWKNGFVNCKTNQVDSVVDRQRVDVEGWLTFDFWEQDGKDRQKPVMFVKTIKENPVEAK